MTGSPSRSAHRALVAAVVACTGIGPGVASAQDRSAGAFLQLFEASYATIEKRTPDIFNAGYANLWLPPPGRADQGDLSVGYDPYDRFDLGSPGRYTLYGSETGIKTSISALRRASVGTYVDLVWNHAGYSNLGTPGFTAAGGYPGLLVTTPGDIDGDFHGAFESGDWNMRVAGLLDIAQEKNHRFIRNPVTPGDVRNIPAGTTPAFGRLANVPTEGNRRFYPDRDVAPARMVFDPLTGQGNIPIYDFTPDAATTGDPIEENALGYLMRNTQWLVQDVGVDGFRIDAQKHMPQWVMGYFDRAVYRANPRPRLDGSVKHVFSFGETYDGNRALVQSYIRKDINDADPGRVGGNRDQLDFPLFFAMRDNLSSNGLVNDWRNVVNASQDVQDDGLANNGSQGVAFAQSHDDFGPHLSNVAHAYMLMRPGNAVVYFNAKEFGTNRSFPKDGRGDALGGLYGDRITTLVNLRNTHGRGNYLPRLLEKEALIYEREKSALVVLSNRLDGGYDSRTVQTAFPAGTPLIELTGNASDPTVDPFNDFPELLVVNANGTVNLRVPRNKAPGANGATHNRGYFIYGLATPQGALSFSNVASTIAAETPSAATNGTARLASLPVITADTFNVTLATTPVTLLGIQRDRPADGDQALIRFNGGIDLNGNGVVDWTDPNRTSYGFEEFVTTRNPGYDDPGGNGLYVQAIDATTLPEGMNFVTVRAYRQRGDGGPAVFTDFRRTIYVDRLKPDSDVDSFQPWDAAAPQNRDLIVKSLDKTAERVHVFLNIGSAVDEATILSWVNQTNRAGSYDRDLFKYGFFGVPGGNNVATVVTYEISGNYNVQRVPGVFVSQGRGLGLGDINLDGAISPIDLSGGPAGNQNFETYLYSRNQQFVPSADVNADGRIDNLDLFALPALYQSISATQAVLDETRNTILRRGNLNGDAATDATDIDHLFSQFGATGDIWTPDLNVDAAVTSADVDTLVRTIFHTEYGDANLDQSVNIADFAILGAAFNTTAGWAGGDFTGDGSVGIGDFALLASNFNFTYSGSAVVPDGTVVARGNAVPEPSTAAAVALAAFVAGRRRRA